MLYRLLLLLFWGLVVIKDTQSQNSSGKTLSNPLAADQAKVEKLMKALLKGLQTNQPDPFLELTLSQEEISRRKETPQKKIMDSILVSPVWKAAFEEAKLELLSLHTHQFLYCYVTGLESGIHWKQVSYLNLELEKPVFEPPTDVKGERFYEVSLHLRDELSKKMFLLKTVLGMVDGKASKMVNGSVQRVEKSSGSSDGQWESIGLRDVVQGTSEEQQTELQKHYRGRLGTDSLYLHFRYVRNQDQLQWKGLEYRFGSTGTFKSLAKVFTREGMMFEDQQKRRWCIATYQDLLYGFLLEAPYLTPKGFKINLEQ